MISMYQFLQIFFYGIPLAAILFFAISLYCYCKAKKTNKMQPGTFTEEELKIRKVLLIVSSVIMGILVVVVIAFIALLSMAVAFM